MARTAAGTTLTNEHRRAQLEVRAGALQDFMRLWPLWDGSEATFRDLIAASLPLIRQYHNISSSVAASYYDAFRRAERVGGSPTPRLAVLDESGAAAGLYLTGSKMTQEAVLAGQSPQAARQTALVRVSGVVTRQVLNGGRGTVVLSSAADKQSGGWSRVTSGDCCAFCALIAANGPVYSEDTYDFEAHDHCACTGEPTYDGSEWPGRGREFKDMYDRAVASAKESGDLERGTSNDLLNAFRREFSAA